MRTSLLPVLLAAFCYSTPIEASPVTIEFFSEGGDMSFGPAGVHINESDEMTCHCDPEDLEAFGFLTIHAGPLLNLSVTRDAAGNPVSSLYQYPDATLTFVSSFGNFTARSPMFHFTVREDPPPSFRGVIREDVQMVDAVFDPDLATYFRIGQDAGDFLYQLVVIVTGTPDSPLDRSGDSFHNGFFAQAQAIPEPSATTLCLLAGAAVVARRRRQHG
jgi:hypothetical protein